MRLEAINSYTSCNNKLAKYKKIYSSKSSICDTKKTTNTISFTSKPNTQIVLSSFQEIKAQANNKAQYKLLKNKLVKDYGHSKEFVKHILSKQEHDFEILNNIFNKFTEQSIASFHFLTCIETLQFNKNEKENKIDYTPLEDLLNFRDKAVKNKHLLDIHGEKTKDRKVDEILFNRPLSTIETLNILGEKGFIYAFKDKEENLDRYISEFAYNYLSPASKERLIQLTNPTKSKKYNELKESIKEEKAKYNPSLEGAEKKELENKINTLAYQLNELRNNSIKDPKTIFELALLMVSNSVMANKILEDIHSSKDLNSKDLTSLLNKNIYSYFKLEAPSEITQKRLEIKDYKYLIELIKSNDDFDVKYKDLILLLEKHPEKTNLEIFNSLPQNIETRRQFEELGLDYDKWVDSEPLEYTADKYTFRKVDMNNIPYALFLGNYSDCCTRTNGLHSDSAVSYIKNKMFQAIEVLDKDNNPIGNTMCYIVKTAEAPCLILDNIEMGPSYIYKDDIDFLKGFYIIAKKINEKIGTKPNSTIFLGTMSNDVDTTYFPSYLYNTYIVGSSGDERVYFDTLRQAEKTKNLKKGNLMSLHPLEVFIPKLYDSQSL